MTGRLEPRKKRVCLVILDLYCIVYFEGSSSDFLKEQLENSYPDVEIFPDLSCFANLLLTVCTGKPMVKNQIRYTIGFMQKSMFRVLQHCCTLQTFLKQVA